LRLIIGLSERHVDQIQAARQAGPFRSMEDVAKRTGLSTAVLQRLSAADVFRSLGQDRRESLWQSLAQTKSSHEMPLLANIADPAEPDVRLPEVDSFDEVCQDYATMGLSLKAHPISFYRLQLSRLEIRTAAELVELPNDAVVAVAGLVILRQRPSTAKGITFVTLEDETGTVNLVVHQRTWERFYSVARRSPTWIARGTLQRKYSVIHVVVQHLEDMATSLRQFKGASRDFR
jgi:error-prone DNA polymerase